LGLRDDVVGRRIRERLWHEDGIRRGTGPVAAPDSNRRATDESREFVLRIAPRTCNRQRFGERCFRALEVYGEGLFGAAVNRRFARMFAHQAIGEAGIEQRRRRERIFGELGSAAVANALNALFSNPTRKLCSIPWTGIVRRQLIAKVLNAAGKGSRLP
jgi:hypothetical protein